MTDASQQPHPSRPLHVVETPVDPAQQSLADALRTSFQILKLAMVVLVIAYFASGVFTVEQNKQAIILRLGGMVGDVCNPGVHWAFPPPIDQVVEIPVKQSSTVSIASHWLYLDEDEQKIPLAQVRRGDRGLNPVRDGALLTGDKGLVHIKWRLTYRVDDLTKYLAVVSDEDYTRIDNARIERIITKLLERAGIDVAGSFTTEEATRKRLTELRELVKRRVNADLDKLGTGVVVETVEIPKSTPPLQTKLAFDQVIRAENKKQTSIRQAEQEATALLNRTAGAAHTHLITLLDAIDVAQRNKDTDAIARLNQQIDQVVEFEASGEVGSLVRSAKGYYTSVVQGMQADAEQYQTLLAEWDDRRGMLKTRLWEQAKQRLLGNPDIVKVYRPFGAEFRIIVGPDPRQRDIKERQSFLEERGISGTTNHERLVPLIPGGTVE